jgi:2-polyprenyl-6-methoxyphenol hydroxylase-like FAD-dependent oxidoreductase
MPNARIEMGSAFRELIVEGDRVVGVVYRTGVEEHRLRATFSVGADGRGSKVRKAAGFHA